MRLFLTRNVPTLIGLVTLATTAQACAAPAGELVLADVGETPYVKTPRPRTPAPHTVKSSSLSARY